MAETIKLDPSTIATSRTELDITPFISVEGVSWDDARIEQYLSEGNVGSSPVDYKIPNRQVVMPMKLMARGTFTFEQIRRQLQAKVALFQQEGGWVSRVTTAGTLYADVVNASLRLGGDWLQANKSADVSAELSLECVPDLYGDEITLTAWSENTLPALVKVENGPHAGDYPGRLRIRVDEADGEAQLGLLWGLRSRYYDPAASAALFYEAEALTPLDVASIATVAGASGGGSNNVVRHLSLGADWTPALSTQILSGGTHMTQRGTYRAWARVLTTSDTPPRVRLIYDVGDFEHPTENDSKTIPAPQGWYMLDLGEIRIDAAPVGAHRWQGVIQAIGEAGGENIYIDCLYFQPIDDTAGRLVASVSADQGLATYTARDEFNQSSGNLTGSNTAITGATNATPIVITANGHGVVFGNDVWIEGVGGNTAANGHWGVAGITANTFELFGSVGNGAYTSGGTVAQSGKALPSGGGHWHGIGDANDFALDTTNKRARRTATNDTAGTPRYAIAPETSVTTVAVQADVMTSGIDPDASGSLVAGAPKMGVVARYVNMSNNLLLYLAPFVNDLGQTVGLLTVERELAGSTTQIASAFLAPIQLNVAYRLRLAIDAAGRYFGWVGSPGSRLHLTVVGQDSNLATGGALASGRVGLVDEWIGTGGTGNRDYDNFAAWVPSIDAAIYPNQSAELRTDGVFREDQSGAAYGPVTPIGSLPRFPPSGLEGRKCELFLKASRGDFDQIPDTGIDDISAQAFYRPSWLITPGS